MFIRSPRNGLTIESVLILFSFAIAVPAFVPAAHAAEIESRIARGGLLYDYWSEISAGEVPKETHPAYPKTSKKTGRTTWRCKECHGWDYKGKDGYYGKGDNYTGIKGIRTFDGGDPVKVAAILKDKNHALTEHMLKPGDFEDLAFFVTKGQVDMDKYIDSQTKKAKGDATKGEGYYNTICAKCHGTEGKLPKDLQEPLGKLSRRVPWEVLHKIRNGDPGKEMPALRALPVEVGADILVYTQTLPD